MTVDLRALLEAVDDDVKDVLAKNPLVTDRDELDADDLPDAAGETWFRVPDVVAVFIDLQASTKLSVGKHPASTAAIYRAAMKNAVKILHDFAADFIQVQGDGVFGLFWGERPVERGLCAGITAKTFSRDSLEPRLEARWPDAPETGFKVGIAQGSVLVKKVGTPRNPNEQEPIWAGKPVNYAAKAAQQADRGELIVTGGVWLAIEGNDYLTVSCGHGTDENDDLSVLWTDVEIEKLTHDSDDAAGRLLKACWCDECGPAYVKAILAGETTRPETDEVVSKVLSLEDAVERSLLKFEERRDRIARKRGLARVRRRR